MPKRGDFGPRKCKNRPFHRENSPISLRNFSAALGKVKIIPAVIICPLHSLAREDIGKIAHFIGNFHLFIHITNPSFHHKNLQLPQKKWRSPTHFSPKTLIFANKYANSLLKKARTTKKKGRRTTKFQDAKLPLLRT